MKRFSKNQIKLLHELRNSLNEVTSTKTSSGQFSKPLLPGLKLFDNSQLDPFNIPTSEYISAELAYDSYDGEMDTDESDIINKEKFAKKVSIYNKEHPVQTDDDGDIINVDGSIHDVKESDLDNKINEDLAVWFGTKKKPKGSKQPKGPWVNICRKVDGKHPPCGRPEAKSKGYPKCRAAGVAGKMSDSEKRSACAQKRKAEKKEPKSGTGNKPTMTSYKPKKESYLKETIQKILREELLKKTN